MQNQDLRTTSFGKSFSEAARPYGFVRNLGRYNLAVNQDKRVARTSFTVSAPKFSARNAHGDTQQSRRARLTSGPLHNSQYADSSSLLQRGLRFCLMFPTAPCT